MNNIKFFIFTVIFSFKIFFMYSTEVVLYGNYIKLTAYDNGRFNLYGKNSVNDKWTPVLYEDKVPANFLRLFSNNKEIPFGKGGLDRFSDIYIKESKIFYVWYDKKYRVEISYELVNIYNKDKADADALVIDLRVKNTGADTLAIDFYYCFDAYLGERSNEHFIIEDKYIVKNETKVENPGNLTKISSYDKNKKLGVDFIFGQNGESAPSLVYFANWKKVLKTIGFYGPVEGKSFDYLPNSINDSAIFIDYLNQNIEANNEGKYKFVLKLNNTIPQNDKMITKQSKIEEDEKKNILELYNIKEISGLEIKDLLELLDRINRKLGSGEALKEEEVEVLNKVLLEIKKKRAN